MVLKLPENDLNQLFSSKFPKAVEEEAQLLNFNDHHFIDRQEVDGFTIDSPESPDLDDAIHLRETPTGWLAEITISDVDSLVTIETEISREALRRVSTQYFGSVIRKGKKKQLAVPMIPKVLSENRLSLLKGKLRPTLTVQVAVDKSGKILNTTIKKTFLSSSNRFSHSEYEGTRIVGRPGIPMANYLQFARMLSANRWFEGSLGFQELKKGINTNEEGMATRASVPAANQIIQEFMILANRAVAEFLKEHQIPAPYRIHIPSDITTPTRQQIIEEVEKNSNYLKLIDNLRYIFNKSIAAASYSPTPDVHFGLSVPAYTHFTSPIRRYVDLVVHREIKAFISEKKSPYSHAEITQLCKFIDDRTRRINTLRSIDTGNHSFYFYQQNRPQSTEKPNHKSLDQLLNFLSEHRIGNPIFEFSVKPSKHIEVTCTASVRFQRERHVITVSARADKDTIKNEAANRLLRRVRQLQKDFLNSPKSTPRKFSNHFNSARIKPETSVTKLFNYCDENNLPSPNFHYEIWNGSSMPITCHCKINDQLAVTGHGSNRIKSKQAAAEKLLNYLQTQPISRKTLPPAPLADQNGSDHQ